MRLSYSCTTFVEAKYKPTHHVPAMRCTTEMISNTDSAHAFNIWLSQLNPQQQKFKGLHNSNRIVAAHSRFSTYEVLKR